jgi:hypothetical protein
MSILFNKNAYITPIGNLVITPGKNVIPDDVIEKLKEITFVKDQIKLGKWVIESSGVQLTFEDKEKVLPATEEESFDNAVLEISNMETRTAIKTIVGDSGNDGILDIRVLQKLKEADKRKGVQKAIDAQIEFLTVEPEKEGDTI